MGEMGGVGCRLGGSGVSIGVERLNHPLGRPEREPVGQNFYSFSTFGGICIK